MANVSLCIAYDWRDDGADPNVCEQNFGSVRFAPTGNASQPFTPKPFYTAALALQAALGGAAAAAGRVPAAAASGGASGADLFVAAFVGGTAKAGAFAVWSNASAPVAATFSVTSAATPGVAPGACYALVDWLGAPAVPDTACAMGGALTVNASGAPLYALPR